jgi:hypothetical protein
MAGTVAEHLNEIEVYSGRRRLGYVVERAAEWLALERRRCGARVFHRPRISGAGMTYSLYSSADPRVICDAKTRHRLKGAQRQARYRARLQQQSLVPTTVITPIGAHADLQEQAEALRRAPHLRPGPLRDPISGKLVSAKTVLRS